MRQQYDLPINEDLNMIPEDDVEESTEVGLGLEDVELDLDSDIESFNWLLDVVELAITSLITINIITMQNGYIMVDNFTLDEYGNEKE